MSAEDGFSPSVWDKARTVPSGAVREHESDPSVWFVRSVRTGVEHRVQMILDPADEEEYRWVTCTCQHGDVKVSQSRCYHAAAAMMAREKGAHRGE